MICLPGSSERQSIRRAGGRVRLLFCGLLADGLILIETTGRRSDKPRRTPVRAMMMDDHVIVRTFRGERSDWFKNLRADPNVRYWEGGRPRAARANVHVPTEKCPTEGMPPFAALGVAAAALGVDLMGWRFAVLSPRD